MSRTIYDSWRDFQLSFAQILAGATSDLCIFDDDLGKTGIASNANMKILRALLVKNPEALVRIALRDTRSLEYLHPHLVQLLRTRAHNLKIQKVSGIHVPWRDCMILADGRHAAVRFDLEHPRCKLVLDDIEEVEPYSQLFEEIWATPGTPFLPEATGLSVGLS
ncbi:MAG: hypothetical protein LBI31_03645 [Zoogloeaceae bacterium]|jgi:hypothetical protein|nr:hypothetical protein [Zoogloeaceae bacterium]